MKLSSADSLPRAHLEHTTPYQPPLHSPTWPTHGLPPERKREFTLPQCPAFNLFYGLPSNKEKPSKLLKLTNKVGN